MRGRGALVTPDVGDLMAVNLVAVMHATVRDHSHLPARFRSQARRVERHDSRTERRRANRWSTRSSCRDGSSPYPVSRLPRFDHASSAPSASAKRSRLLDRQAQRRTHLEGVAELSGPRRSARAVGEARRSARCCRSRDCACRRQRVSRCRGRRPSRSGPRRTAPMLPPRSRAGARAANRRRRSPPCVSNAFNLQDRALRCVHDRAAPNGLPEARSARARRSVPARVAVAERGGPSASPHGSRATRSAASDAA